MRIALTRALVAGVLAGDGALRAAQRESVRIATVPSAAAHARGHGVCCVAPVALAGGAWYGGGGTGAVAAQPGPGRIGLRRMLGGDQRGDIRHQRSRGARAVDARARRVARGARPARMAGAARPAPERGLDTRRHRADAGAPADFIACAAAALIVSATHAVLTSLTATA